jgi:KUP system potassium uptake protein
VVMKSLVRKPLRFLILITLAFLPLDLLFVSSNAQKILHGGIFPVAIAAVIFMVIKTWTKGESIVEAKRIAIEDPFQKFVDKIRTERIRRVPGEAIYIGHHSDLVPLALVATVEELHELPDKVTIVTIQNTTSAHVPNEQRAVVDELKHLDGISHITLFYGFHDVINIPKALAGLTNLNPELNFDLNKVAYFISSTKIVPSKRHNLANWRKSLYRLMARNALSNSDYYKLPTDRTEEMQTLIGL